MAEASICLWPVRAFSRDLFRQFQVFVLIRLRGEIGGGRLHHLVRLRGENFRVVGDESLLDPSRTAGANPQIEERRLFR
jgi:hypothetical protein